MGRGDQGERDPAAVIEADLGPSAGSSPCEIKQLQRCWVSQGLDPADVYYVYVTTAMLNKTSATSEDAARHR